MQPGVAFAAQTNQFKGKLVFDVLISLVMHFLDGRGQAALTDLVALFNAFTQGRPFRRPQVMVIILPARFAVGLLLPMLLPGGFAALRQVAVQFGRLGFVPFDLVAGVSAAVHALETMQHHTRGIFQLPPFKLRVRTRINAVVTHFHPG